MDTPDKVDVARILIVDDDRSIRRTLEKFLGSEGYDVVTASDAPSAIAAVAAMDATRRAPHAANDPSAPADVMLLDLGLPGGSGFDVLSSLSGKHDAPTVVVV